MQLTIANFEKKIAKIVNASSRIQSVKDACAKNGVSAFLIGGALRDIFYDGVVHGDFDIAIEGNQEVLKNLLLEINSTHRDQSAFESSVDLQLCEDLGMLQQHSDFTLHGAAFDLHRQVLIASERTLNDLYSRTLRMISPAFYAGNPSAFLRIVRIAHQINGVIEPVTLEFTKRFAFCAATVSPTVRVSSLREIFKFFSGASIQPHLDLMIESAVLPSFFHELQFAAKRSLTDSNISHLDYNFELIRESEAVIKALPAPMQDRMTSLIRCEIPTGRRKLLLSFNELARVRFSALCFNIGESCLLLNSGDIPARLEPAAFKWEVTRNMLKTFLRGTNNADPIQKQIGDFAGIGMASEKLCRHLSKADRRSFDAELGNGDRSTLRAALFLTLLHLRVQARLFPARYPAGIETVPMEMISQLESD